MELAMIGAAAMLAMARIFWLVAMQLRHVDRRKSNGSNAVSQAIAVASSYERRLGRP
jgi:hypothetical protein